MVHAANDRRTSRDQRHALRKAQFRFHPRHCAGRGRCSIFECFGSEPIGAGLYNSRVHRPCQSQPGQNQYGFDRHRKHSSCHRRTIQDDGRCKLVHVPYRSSAAATTDLLSGVVQVYFGTTADLIEHIKAGRVRALAVATTTRSEVLPDVPAIAESVPGYEASAWYGVGAPRNTPAAVIEKLNKEINAGLADPKLKAKLADLGGTVISGSPADFGKFIAEEIDKWSKVVKFAGIRAD